MGRPRVSGRFGKRDSSGGRYKSSERADSGRDRSGRGKPGRGKFGGRDSKARPERREARSEMHSVTCDKCKARCEVPFLPTGGKPVYCSDCYRKNPDSKNANNDGEFKKINEKLDKIMAALKISS
jgi:CxxC-x17-CxxC domain-containing protein